MKETFWGFEEKGPGIVHLCDSAGDKGEKGRILIIIAGIHHSVQEIQEKGQIYFEIKIKFVCKNCVCLDTT